jgi:hypothetical protein
MTSCAITQEKSGDILARFKGNNTRRPLFFSACAPWCTVCWHGTSKQHTTPPPEKTRAAKLVVDLLSDQRLQAAVEQLTGRHPTHP